MLNQTERRQLADRALEGRTVEDGDCLIWTGRLSCSAGHPKYKNLVVRRVVWQADRPLLVPSQLITTTCGNPKCLSHLAITGKSEIARKTNADPRVKAIKRVKSAEHSRKTDKLSMDAARAIRESDKGNQELAAEYGVVHSLISKVRRNVAWVELRPNPFSGLGSRA